MNLLITSTKLRIIKVSEIFHRLKGHNIDCTVVDIFVLLPCGNYYENIIVISNNKAILESQQVLCYISECSVLVTQQNSYLTFTCI